MKKVLVALAVVAVAGAAILAARDGGSGLDLTAISECERPRVAVPPPHEDVALDLTLGVEQITDLEGTIAADHWIDGRLVVAVRTGPVVVIDPSGAAPDQEILDLSDRITLNDEGGVLGVAVDPDGAHLYVHHTDHDGTSHVLAYRIDEGRLDPGSERVLLTQPHPGLVHNGGHLVFGPDGYLYLGFGDGSLKVGQALESASTDTLAAKLLRIEPTPEADEPYAIPPGNPYADGSGRPEIFVSGLRNPWRFSFDEHGALWIGDVGNDCYEEIDVLDQTVAARADLGWPRFEAFHALAAGRDDGTSVFPVFAYPHDGTCAVIGGQVYEGDAIPDLDGRYLYQDLCEGRLRWLERTSRGTRGGVLDVEVPTVIAFWRDDAGEVYLLGATAGMYRLVDRAGA